MPSFSSSLMDKQGRPRRNSAGNVDLRPIPRYRKGNDARAEAQRQAIEKGKETRRQKKLLANHQQYVMERPRRSSETSSTPGTFLALLLIVSDGYQLPSPKIRPGRENETICRTLRPNLRSRKKGHGTVCRKRTCRNRGLD